MLVMKRPMKGSELVIIDPLHAYHWLQWWEGVCPPEKRGCHWRAKTRLPKSQESTKVPLILDRITLMTVEN